MKLIHCADLHLDSPMESNLPPEKARERKNEILSTFAKLVRLADEGEVSAILIAGDLFDSNHATKKAQKYVLDLIAAHPRLYFFYLAGNHDRGSLWKAAEELPENLYTFDDGWTSYQLDGVTVTGSERPDPATLQLDADAVNIVLMHGQAQSGQGAKKEDVIHFGKLKNKNIDYMALGHLHGYQAVKLDDRCTACYCGCLEGRGFDECGSKGYVLLEVANHRVEHRFVSMAKRQLHAVSCDITGLTSQLELEERVMEAVKEIPKGDLVKVILTGSCPADSQKDVEHLRQMLSDRFYFAKIYDESRLMICPEDYRNDISLVRIE